MFDPVHSKATICVVNYKTLDMTRVCLRSLRRHTDSRHEVVVIDNNSRDSSLDYLKGLSWIRLAERHPETPDPSGSYAHGAALDLGLGLCQTEFFVTLHSDAIVCRPDWLDYFLDRLRSDSAVACCGVDNLEMKPRWQILVHKAFDVKALQRRLFAGPAARLHYRPFIRTICAVYRTEVLRREGLSFLPDIARRLTVGQKLHFDLQERGYKTVQVPDRVACQYVVHLAHATQMLNPSEFGFGRIAKKWRRRAGPWLASESFQALLQDECLDR
jgi:GT2 family glycosyltransferase